MPERIWAVHHETHGAVMIGEWADTIRHIGGDEYISADAHRTMIEAAVKRALYATRDRTWSGVEALIADPDAIREIVEGGE
jgi:hypothetical protein